MVLVITNKQALKRRCIYEILEVKQLGTTTYKVTNIKKKTSYIVTINPDSCTCIAYSYNNKCKHITAVKDQEQKEQEKHEHIAVERTEELMVLD